jgi:hypothetical protein
LAKLSKIQRKKQNVKDLNQKGGDLKTKSSAKLTFLKKRKLEVSPFGSTTFSHVSIRVNADLEGIYTLKSHGQDKIYTITFDKKR